MSSNGNKKYSSKEIINLLGLNSRIRFVVKKKFRGESHTVSQWKKLLNM